MICSKIQANFLTFSRNICKIHEALHGMLLSSCNCRGMVSVQITVIAAGLLMFGKWDRLSGHPIWVNNIKQKSIFSLPKTIYTKINFSNRILFDTCLWYLSIWTSLKRYIEYCLQSRTSASDAASIFSGFLRIISYFAEFTQSRDQT